jgi:hypothetical protein
MGEIARGEHEMRGRTACRDAFQNGLQRQIGIEPEQAPVVRSEQVRVGDLQYPDGLSGRRPCSVRPHNLRIAVLFDLLTFVEQDQAVQRLLAAVPDSGSIGR